MVPSRLPLICLALVFSQGVQGDVMAIELPPKKYYSFTELAERFQCGEQDLDALASLLFRATPGAVFGHLKFFGEQGLDIEQLRTIVARIQKQIDDAHDRAATFFNIFKNEWAVQQADIDKYIDPASIYHFIELTVADAASTKARLKAVKSHAEDYATKNSVFAWLDSNMAEFKSMDAAAQAIIKQQPIAFRTARDWVGDWKKLRSASRP